MVIDAAKGIEPQTRKLFEVCRLRDIPIITFINKIDREAQDPFELLDEIASTAGARRRAHDLADRHRARPSRACYDLASNRMLVFDGERPQPHRRGRSRTTPSTMPQALAEEVELVRAGYPAFDLRGLSRRPPDAGVLRQRLNNFGVARAARRARRLGAAAAPAAGRAARRSSRPSPRSPASCSRSRPTWTPTTATASPSCGCARASSAAA